MRELGFSRGDDDNSGISKKATRALGREISRAFDGAEEKSLIWQARDQSENLETKRQEVEADYSRLANTYAIPGLNYLIDRQREVCIAVIDATDDLETKIDAVSRFRAFGAGLNLATRIIDEPSEPLPYAGDYDDALAFAYDAWCNSLDADARNKELTIFLHSQGAPNLARELLDADDETTIAGAFKQNQAMIWNDVLQLEGEESDGAIPLRRWDMELYFQEGILSALFAIRERQTLVQMIDTVYKDDINKFTTTNRMKAAVYQVVTRFYGLRYGSGEAED